MHHQSCSTCITRVALHASPELLYMHHQYYNTFGGVRLLVSCQPHSAPTSFKAECVRECNAYYACILHHIHPALWMLLLAPSVRAVHQSKFVHNTLSCCVTWMPSWRPHYLHQFHPLLRRHARAVCSKHACCLVPQMCAQYAELSEHTDALMKATLPASHSILIVRLCMC